MPGGQVEVLHSQDNGYFYIPLASIITAVMFAPKVVATKFSIHLKRICLSKQLALQLILQKTLYDLDMN